jgi:DNA-directed RNA polymerase III subunit RPC2
MVYPQKPLVKTFTIELTNYDKLPAGQNASVAVMSYSGYDIEDAVVLNKASLDRGFGRCMVIKKQQGEMKKYDNGASEIRKAPEKTEKENYHKKKTVSHLEQKFHAIDKDGLPFIGSKLLNGDVFINKYTPINKTDLPNEEEQVYTPSPIAYKGSTPSIVDRVMITSTSATPELIN